MKDIKLFEKGRIRISIAWYDIWIGIFIDNDKKKIYFCFIPAVLLTYKYK